MTFAPDALAAVLGGRYRLERELGQGGMATVWLAHDLRHNRQVAIKVLHPELAAVLGPDRFLKEIELTAGLQHPHILPLFDSGHAPGGLLYYVVPFVEGGSLRDRLTREHQLSVADALRIATDVAGALEYAHAKGVIHRDIKPENILLHDGRPVVADFGIALAVQQAGGQRMTQTGLSLGTPQYMAPEQAMGERTVDARADVYALGCVLYEMLAGEPPFTGPTAQAVMAKVLNDDPRPLAELRKTVPVHVDDAIRIALEKLAADRFPSAAAFAAAIADQDSGARRAAGRARAASPARTWALLGALALVTGLGAWGWLRERNTAAAEPSILDVALPENSEVITFYLGRTLAISPDGRHLALNVGRSGGQEVITRSLDARAATVVRPGLAPNYLFFDATGAALLLLNNDGQTRVTLDGSQVMPVTIPGAFNLIGQPDGTILTTTIGGDLIRKLAGADSVEVLLSHDSATGDGYWLQDQLPDGRLLVQVGVRNQVMAPIDLLDPRSGRRTRVLDAALEARFAQGYLVYVLATGQLLAQPFDPDRPDPTARPVALADSVATVANIAHFAVAKNGTVAYRPISGAELMRVDRDGIARTLLPALRSYHAPRVSPDGRRVLVDFISEGRRDIWVHDPAQNTLTRATFIGDGHDGRWTLDGRAIVFAHTDDAGGVAAYHATPGNSAIHHLYGGPGTDYIGEWLGSMDQAVVVGGLDLIRVRIAEHKTEPLVATRFGEGWPAPSPDGKWLAWASDESGRHEVYLRAVDGGERIQVSTDGGREPVWARNGLLYYRGTMGDHTMMVEAAIATTPNLRVTRRTPLFDDRPYASADPHAGYDVWPDGGGFAMVRPTGVSRVTVIQNFPELARRKAGVAP